jgi:hypothetical protein
MKGSASAGERGRSRRQQPNVVEVAVSSRGSIVRYLRLRFKFLARHQRHNAIITEFYGYLPASRSITPAASASDSVTFERNDTSMRLGQALETARTVLKNVFLGGNIISLSLLAKPQEMIGYISESLFLYKTISSKRGLPQKNVYEILQADNIETIRLGNLKGVAWFLARASNAVDIVSLCLICQIIKPKVVFEIGTMRGYTSFHFALNTPDDTKIYTLDLLQNEHVDPKLKTTITDDIHIKSHARPERYCFENSDVASKIMCLFGDSAAFDFSPFYHSVDFFFIDGAHSYEYVRSDTLNALKCCHPGSVIAWHDFGRAGVNGVTTFLLELAKEGRDIYAVPGGSLAFAVIK